MHRGGGHNITYVRAVLTDARNRGWRCVVVLTRAAVEHASFDLIRDAFDFACLLEIIDELPSDASNGRGSWIRRQLSRHRQMMHTYRVTCARHGIPDAVFVPDSEHWYAASALLGSPVGKSRLVSISFSVRFHRSHHGVLSSFSRTNAKCQEQLFELCLRRRAINQVLVSDETLIDHYRKKKSSILRHLRYLPEIADLPQLVDKGDARKTLKIRADAHVVLCYGVLSRRKGIPELLEGLEDSNCPPSVVALLAGETDEEMRRLLEGEKAQALRNKQRLFWEDGFLDDQHTALAFSASDSAWLGYRNFENSSGFLWQGARAGIPPISCTKGLIGYWTRSCRLGQTIDPANSKEVVKALRQVASNSELRAHWVANCIQEAKAHTAESFGRTVCDALSQQMDGPTRPFP